MDWDKLRVFHAVAEAGSFTHAGEQLNLSQSAVSRQISALEESLSVPLFHRHARGLILTEQGEMLYRTARDVFSKLAMTEARLADTRESPSGPLKVHHHRRLRHAVADAPHPRFPRALSRHPGIAGGRRRRARPGHARSRRGDPHGAAAPAGPGAAPPDDAALEGLCLARLSRALRHPARRWRTSTTTGWWCSARTPSCRPAASTGCWTPVRGRKSRAARC